MKKLAVASLVALLLLNLTSSEAFSLTIEEVIGVYTFSESSAEGFRSGFLEFGNDHTYKLVIHLDRDLDRITDDYEVRRGEYYVKRRPDKEPGIFLTGDGGAFLEQVRIGNERYRSFCCFDICFERRGPTDRLFPEGEEKREMSGPVFVVTEPAGATVKLDGELLPEATPMTIPGMAAGLPHSLEIELRDMNPKIVPLNLREGESRRIEIRLSSGDAELVARSVPWTNVFVDGRYVGRTPTEGLRIPAGTHTVLLQNDGAGIFKQFTVDLAEGQTWEKMFKFFGRLSIRTDPPADAYVGDVYLGRTPLENRKVPVGIQRLRLVDSESGREKTINVRIELDKLQVIEGAFDSL